MRFLFYSHDGLGLGHTRRHVAVASALSELAPEASILLASGADDVNRLGLPAHIEVLKLPGLRKVANDQYASRRLRIPTSEIRALRAALLLTAVKAFHPSVVLVDKHPFGISGEFRAALDVLRRFGGRAVLGLRDILDERQTVLKEWAPHNLQKRIARYFDLVLVYGHRAIFDPIAQYDFPSALAARTRFCGYVVNQEKEDLNTDMYWSALNLQTRSRPVVLATAGGGEDGFLILERFLRAAAGAPWQGIAIAGPMTPKDEFNTLQRLAVTSRVALHSFVPSLSSLFWSVDALVCMGGYNTLAEAVSKGVPTVCIPRQTPRLEQLIRALSFERLGLVKTIQAENLTVETLRDAVSTAVGLSRHEMLDRANASLNFDGARQAANHLLALAAERPRVALDSKPELAL
jgi:predicted glycosyltransferase